MHLIEYEYEIILKINSWSFFKLLRRELFNEKKIKGWFFLSFIDNHILNNINVIKILFESISQSERRTMTIMYTSTTLEKHEDLSFYISILYFFFSFLQRQRDLFSSNMYFSAKKRKERIQVASMRRMYE